MRVLLANTQRSRSWRVESLADENGKKFPGYVADMTT
jgi:hypothetical protein